MKVTVYVRPKDEVLMNLVAEATGKKLSGWAYDVLVRAAEAESKRRGIEAPAPGASRRQKRKPPA